MSMSTIAERHPSIIRRRLGSLTIEASAIGGGRVGVVVEGPVEAVSRLGSALAYAGWLVELYTDKPGTMYCEGRGPEPVVDLSLGDEEPTVRYSRSARESGVQACAGRA